MYMLISYKSVSRKKNVFLLFKNCTRAYYLFIIYIKKKLQYINSFIISHIIISTPPNSNIVHINRT